MRQTQAHQAELLRQRITDLTGISSNEQLDMLHEQAYQWLERWTDMDSDIIGMVTRTKSFWGWWANQWRITDRVFIARREHPYALPCNVAAEWRRMHDAEGVQLFPPQSITEEAFRQMKDAVTQEVKLKINAQ